MSIPMHILPPHISLTGTHVYLRPKLCFRTHLTVFVAELPPVEVWRMKT